MSSIAHGLRGKRWQPLSEALKRMESEDAFRGPMRLAQAVMAGTISLLGQHSNGRDIGKPVQVPIAEMQSYRLTGLFGHELIPGGPILLRGGAPLPETLFPPYSPKWKSPAAPKTWAYTDFWFDLRYDHYAFEFWLTGGADSVAAQSSSGPLGRMSDGHKRKQGKKTAENACYAWLKQEMKAALDNRLPQSKPKLVWRKIALEKYEDLNVSCFNKAWERACAETESNWDLGGRRRKIKPE